MTTLGGKTALVTGGSRGIGRAICARLAADGARVVVHYGHDHDAAERTVAAIHAAGGVAAAVAAPLDAVDGIDALFAGLGPVLDGAGLDVVVNNAGGNLGTGSIEHTTPEEFDRLVALNMRAPFFVVQRALPLLRPGGRIVNISSADTRIAIAGELAYSMAKGAIDVFGRTLAHALGARGITVNTVAPGITDTEANAWLHASPEIEAASASAAALRRIGRPEDIADVVAFLVGHDARWITGQVLDATGGTFLGPALVRELETAAP